VAESGADDDDGGVARTLERVQAEKRARLMRDTTPLQRGIIRHVVLVLDLSAAMAEKDLRPTRYLLTLSYAAAFVAEFFEQNPISQLAVLGMRDGLAVRVSPMSGNPAEHLAAINRLRSDEPKGNPSLQNALEMARVGLL
jgi:transcription initiation factor TFIIH subunit 2